MIFDCDNCAFIIRSGPVHEIRVRIKPVRSEGSDESVHVHILDKATHVHIHKNGRRGMIKPKTRLIRFVYKLTRLILTKLLHAKLINVGYLTACVFIDQVMMTLCTF